MSTPTRRGTTNRNDRGSSYDRAARRAWLLLTWGDGRTCPCYRCGTPLTDATLTVDRIVPGRDGGTYRRDNIRPACAPCNSETGGALAAGRAVVIGVDPGPLPGLAQLAPDGGAQLAQVTPGALPALVRALVAAAPRGPAGPAAVLAVERFVVGRRAARSATPQAGQITRDLVGLLLGLADELGIPSFARTASEVKPWATDRRLDLAGLLIKGMPHARDAGRHALFAAVHDCGLPDPLSRATRSPR